MPVHVKYFLLGRYLAEQPLAVREVTLTFGAIGTIIEAPLPPSARGHAWWSNAPRTIARAWVWLEAGWRVQRPNLRLGDPSVTFVRQVTA